MAEENFGQTGTAGQSNGQSDAQNSAVPLKKPKTEAQRLREKERRRRRRQKKRAEEGAEPVAKDVSFLNPKTEGTAIEVAPDLSLQEIKDPQGEEFSGLEMPKMIGTAHEGAALTEEESAAYEHLDVPPPLPPTMENTEDLQEEQVVEAEPQVKEVYFQPKETVETEEAEQELPEAVENDVQEEAQPEIVNEPAPDIRKLEVPASVQAFENVEEVQPEVDLDEQERLRESENLQKVSELNQHLDSLEEIPVKQGFLGKMFDWVSGRFAKKDVAENEVQEVLSSNAEDTDFGGELIKKIIGAVILIALVIGAFWLGSSLKLIDRVMDLFKPGDIRLVLQQADPNLQIIDLELLRGNGFRSAELFGENSGDAMDTAYPSFKVAYYFGNLAEPIFVGETGITAALYYGFREEENYLKNRFILYVEELEKLNNTNTVNIDEYLSQSVRRDLALDKYLEELQKAFDDGNALRKEIGVQADELKIALNSTNPDKDRFEADFFTSLSTYEGEKADELLGAFVEVTQKQAEFRAKLAAMTNLYEAYETILLRMKVRIEAIEKNKGALVTGVKVRDIPNSGLDLVIE
ncbi:MAG: hypothetical protein ACRCZE_05460 [Candidatus Altimarinota bacterium]